MSNTVVFEKPSQLDEAAIADLFDLDAQHESAEAAPQGFSRSANCTNDGCTRTCVCGPR